MLWAPILALMDRMVPALVLPFAFGLYVVVLCLHIPMPTWPTNNTWFFNPMAWQLIFTLGFVLGGNSTPAGSFVRRHITTLRALAVPIVLLGAVATYYNWTPDPTAMPEPKLLFVWHKTYLTPSRLISFLALVLVMSGAFPYIWRAMPSVVGFLSGLGRNALHVFCLGSVLSLWAQFARYIFQANLLVDTVIVVLGVALMAAIARVVEWKDGWQKRP